MLLSELLTPQQIIPDMKATSKKQVLSELASFAAGQLGIEDRMIQDVLVERERLGSTGMGDGVAIPHGRLPQLDKLFVAFARLSRPVSFDSPDGRPVDLVFLLLTPESADGDHLTALAKISRMMRDERFCTLLRGMASAEAIYSAMLERDQK